MPIELTYLAWTIILGLVQLVVVAVFFTAANGPQYGLGPRDAPPKPMSTLGGRFERAFRNLAETFPFAAAAILIAAVSGRQNALTGLGASLYFWGRVAFVPLYAAGIPVARTIAWAVSVAGIILVLAGALRG